MENSNKDRKESSLFPHRFAQNDVLSQPSTGDNSSSHNGLRVIGCSCCCGEHFRQLAHRLRRNIF